MERNNQLYVGDSTGKSITPRFRHLVFVHIRSSPFSLFLEKDNVGATLPRCGRRLPCNPRQRFPILSWVTSEAFTLGSNCSSSRPSASDCGGWDSNPRLRVMNPARNHSSTPRYITLAYQRKCISRIYIYSEDLIC